MAEMFPRSGTVITLDSYQSLFDAVVHVQEYV